MHSRAKIREEEEIGGQGQLQQQPMRVAPAASSIDDTVRQNLKGAGRVPTQPLRGIRSTRVWCECEHSKRFAMNKKAPQ